MASINVSTDQHAARHAPGGADPINMGLLQDGAVAGFVNTPGSSTRTATDALYAPASGSSTYETQVHASGTYQTAAGLDSATAAEVNTPGTATDVALRAGYVRADGVVWDALSHGIKADTVELTDARCTAGSNAVNCPGASFTSADVGKKIAIMGAGSGGGVISTGTGGGNFITAVTDGQNITMTNNASVNTVAARTVIDGVMARDSQTLTSATAAFTAGDVGKTVTIPLAGETGRRIVTELASITSGAAVLSAAFPFFGSSLVGQTVKVAGAGASGAPLYATVLSVAGDNKSCTLDTNAGTTISGWAVVQAYSIATLTTVITVYTSATSVQLRRRATQPMSGASVTISGHAAVYGTDDQPAWNALTSLVSPGDVITLRRGHLSLLGGSTWTIDRALTLRFGDKYSSGFHMGLSSGRITASADGVVWENVLVKGTQANGRLNTFATKSSARNNQDWRFVNCRWDGASPNFERIGAMLTDGTIATTGSDFAKRVILDGCEITGVAADGALYVNGCDDVTAIAPWVHDTGQDLNSGECIKVAAGARNFRLIGGLSEWGARDGIDCFDAVDAKIDGFESRHNQVNGLEVKWGSGSPYSFNSPGRHSIRMRSWNNGLGANISTRFTDISIAAIANRATGLRVGGSMDNNDQTVGVNIYQATALGNDGVGVLLTNQTNLNGAGIQAHGNGLEGVNIQGASSVDVDYQAFGNFTTGCHVYTGSTKVYLRGHSQDADGVATVDSGATGVVRNGYGEETVGVGGQPTSTLWPSGTTVKNLTDGSVWRRTFTSWDNIGIVGLDLQGWGYPMTCEPGLGSTSITMSAPSTRYFRVKGSGTISKIALEVVASSGNISVAVYSPTGVGKAAKPGTQKATSGSVACPAVGYAELSLGASIAVNAGDFMAFSVDNITASIRAAGGTPTTTALSDGAEWAGGSFPCPSSVGTLSSISGRLPVLVGVA